MSWLRKCVINAENEEFKALKTIAKRIMVDSDRIVRLASKDKDLLKTTVAIVSGFDSAASSKTKLKLKFMKAVALHDILKI